MSTGHRFLTDYGKAITTPGGDYKIVAPSSGGTFAQRGLAFGTSTVGAGTFVLPDNGLPMYVIATGAVTLNSAASVRIATLASGEAVLCLPLTATTWAAVRLNTDIAPTVVNAKYSTSSTATTVTPAAATWTGARHVYWENTADGALDLTTPTNDDLRSAAGLGGSSVFAHLLTITNRGNNTITMTGGTDVGFVGENTLATLVTRTYVVNFLVGSTVTLTSVSKGTIET